MLPTGWNDITMYEFEELAKIDKELSDSYFSNCLEKLCFLTDSDHWDEMDVNEVYDAIGKVDWLFQQPGTSHKEVIKDIYHLKPFGKITLAEWIDLDKMAVNGEFSKVIAMFYRKTKVGEWGETIFEPYHYSIDERVKTVVEDEIVTDVYGVYSKFIEYRSRVLAMFRELFEDTEEDFEATEEDRKYLSDAEIEQIKRDVQKLKEKQQFAWQNLVDGLANEQLQNAEQILNLPVLFVFRTMLSRKKFATN